VCVRTTRGPNEGASTICDVCCLVQCDNWWMVSSPAGPVKLTRPTTRLDWKSFANPCAHVAVVPKWYTFGIMPSTNVHVTQSRLRESESPISRSLSPGDLHSCAPVVGRGSEMFYTYVWSYKNVVTFQYRRHSHRVTTKIPHHLRSDSISFFK
jgi:hypothetical protein